MRSTLVKIFVLLMFSIASQAQELKPISFYLQHSGVSEDAIEFYTGRLTTKNIDKALETADSMFTDNNETRPFYILLTTRMLKTARGDLSKQLTVVCRHFAEQHPSDLAAFLYQKNHLVSSRFSDYWAYRIAVDIRVICDGDLMTCFKQSRNIALSNCVDKYKPKMEVLYNLVRRNLNLFQQR
ncbi:MAG: hypothetical protein R2800_09160 [Flavipsychrobacter sp.]